MAAFDDIFFGRTDFLAADMIDFRLKLIFHAPQASDSRLQWGVRAEK
jgi:hypothetical protein